MIAAQRRARILDRVRVEGAAAIADLAEAIGVSPSTVRRDLDYLMREGYLVRSHGGAMLAEAARTAFEPAREIGLHRAQAAKRAIGRWAGDRLEPGQSVIFDSSSTVLEAAQAVVARGIPLTACTNDLAIAATLARCERIHLVVMGGSVRPGSLTLVGEPGRSLLGQLHADVALIGIHSLAAGRLSETSLEIAAMKRAMIACAANVWVLADSTKLDHPAFCDVCAWRDVQRVVSDGWLSARDREALIEAGVRLDLVAAD